MRGNVPSRRSRQWIVLLVLLAIACGAHFVRSTGKAGDISYNSVTFGAAIVAIWYAWRLDSTIRGPWLWIAFGVFFSGLGDLTFTILVWQRNELPDASLGDLFWLMSYPALAIGLAGMLGLSSQEAGQKKRYDIDALIDLASFVILAMIVVGQITNVGDNFANTDVSMSVQLIWAAYPILDAALLAVLIRALVGRRARGVSGGLLAFGIGCWLASDLATLLIADVSTLSVWMDLGWMLGAASLAGGICAAASKAAPDAGQRIHRRVEGARVLISLSPLLVPMIIETWTYFRHQNLNPVPFLVATVALITLAYLRSTRLVRARDLQAAELVKQRRYYRALAQNSADAVLVVDADGELKTDAAQLAAMLGTQPHRLATNVVDLLDPADRDRGLVALERVRASRGIVQEVELRAAPIDGATTRWFAVRAVNLLDDPTVNGIVLNIHEVTDRKRAEDELTHRAFHDSLTGLANRALFLDRVEHALQRTARSGADVVVVYLDIDGFKTVNDSRGHEAGDEVLREVARRLQATVRSGDTIARLGGDEFAILIDQDVTSGEEGRVLADRILQVLRPPMELGDQHIMLSASIGITRGDVSATASSMLRDADIAMYRSKTTGKGRWTEYDTKMRHAALERAELESDLWAALENRQFHLEYQPVIELVGEKIVGFEALLRWDHPTRGIVQPDAFIPIAEENGCIVPIGEWVLEEACRMGAKFRREHPRRPLTMAVNLSTRQIATVDIVEHVADALLQSGLPPSSLILEMTESTLVEDADLAAQRLHQLRALGVKLAIDDFGTGYSSLSYLRQFPIDILKIDRSFINSITDRDNIPAIVRGLLDLGKTLQLETVAEGIELGVQRDSLRAEHCEYGQGFLFARPLTVPDCEELLTHLDEEDFRRTVGNDLLTST